MLSVVEWEHLTHDQKELHSTMRESWPSSYSKASHTVLQHWLWRFLKKQTESFAPLHKVHKVFSKIKVDSPDSGTCAWTEIFLLYLVTGASIAHKLLDRGLKTCLNFKTDSMVSALDYIASVNVSASQLSHVEPMTVQKTLFPNAELNLLSPGSGCPLQAGTGHGRPGRAPGRC